MMRHCPATWSLLYLMTLSTPGLFLFNRFINQRARLNYKLLPMLCRKKVKAVFLQCSFVCTQSESSIIITHRGRNCLPLALLANCTTEEIIYTVITPIRCVFIQLAREMKSHPVCSSEQQDIRFCR